ncbi:MAG: PHP domain-containing protein [Ruminococcus sp.]|nr:PHP domain-containing protein [Candidatus Copronaster equi]
MMKEIKMFKTETHLHTKESSNCGWIYAEKMVELYYQKGYTTIFISDHFDEVNLEKFGDISWEEKIDKYFSGYNNAKNAAQKYGMNILFSPEVGFKDYPNHHLCIGLTPGLLKSHPDFLDMNRNSFYKLMHENGVFVVQAHPFRANCFPDYMRADALEIRNCNQRHFVESDEKRTLKVAEEFGLPVTAGSDAHRTEDIGLSGIMTEKPITTEKEYIETIKNGTLVLI